MATKPVEQNHKKYDDNNDMVVATMETAITYTHTELKNEIQPDKRFHVSYAKVYSSRQNWFKWKTNILFRAFLLYAFISSENLTFRRVFLLSNSTPFPLFLQEEGNEETKYLWNHDFIISSINILKKRKFSSYSQSGFHAKYKLKYEFREF